MARWRVSTRKREDFGAAAIVQKRLDDFSHVLGKRKKMGA